MGYEITFPVCLTQKVVFLSTMIMMISSCFHSPLNKSVDCITVNDGFAALKKLEQDPLFRPDFIFLDLNLPGINGFDCLTRIKANAALSHIPVVIYTTSASEEDIIKTKNLGAAGFITKPYHITDLTITLMAFF